MRSMKLISMWIDDSDLEQVKMIAERKRLKYSQVLRVAVAEFVERNQPTRRTPKAAKQKRGK